MASISPSERKAARTHAVRANSRELALGVLRRSEVLLSSMELMDAYSAELGLLPDGAAASYYSCVGTFKSFAMRTLPYTTVGKVLDELETKWSWPIKPYGMRNESPLYYCEERADEQKRNWVKKNVTLMSKGDR